MNDDRQALLDELSRTHSELQKAEERIAALRKAWMPLSRVVEEWKFTPDHATPKVMMGSLRAVEKAFGSIPPEHDTLDSLAIAWSDVEPNAPVSQRRWLEALKENPDLCASFAEKYRDTPLASLWERTQRWIWHGDAIDADAGLAAKIHALQDLLITPKRAAVIRETVLQDYLGGYHEEHDIKVFRHGMETVCNLLDSHAKRIMAVWEKEK